MAVFVLADLRYSMYNEGILNNLNQFKLVKYVLLYNYESDMNQIHMTYNI